MLLRAVTGFSVSEKRAVDSCSAMRVAEMVSADSATDTISPLVLTATNEPRHTVVVVRCITRPTVSNVSVTETMRSSTCCETDCCSEAATESDATDLTEASATDDSAVSAAACTFTLAERQAVTAKKHNIIMQKRIVK